MTGNEVLIRDAIEICSVAAPTGKEERRGRFVRGRFEGLGLTAAIDGAGNVVAELPGDPALPCVALAAHLDTVFPEEGTIAVRREGGFLHAPGIGDNSMGIAALLALARDLPRSGIGRVILAATVGEEGNGDLRGARRLVEDLGAEIDAFLAVEGAMRDRIVTVGLGVERLRIVVRGPGGHSWADAGVPSAIDGAARLVADLYDLEIRRVPPTTLNVGTIRGGQSVNSIADRAEFDLDLRSIEQEAVDLIRSRVLESARARFGEDGPLRVELETIGSRPAGRIAPDHPLLAHVVAARAEAGLPPAEVLASSTDANIPLAAGIPAACVGIGFGEDVHRPTERIREEGLTEGLAALLDATRRIAADTELLRR